MVVKSQDELSKEVYDHFIGELGSGSEGKCYLDDQNMAVKIFYNEAIKAEQYDAAKMITCEDIKTQCFLFPKELIFYKKILIGYKTEYVKRDLFSSDSTMNFNNLKSIDFNLLKLAYAKMLKESVMLGEEKIRIYDLTYNLMFDGTNLYAIDTYHYSKENHNTISHNIDCLNTALDYALNCYLSLYNYESIHIGQNESGFAYLDRFRYMLKNNLLEEKKRNLDEEKRQREFVKEILKKNKITI